MLCGDGLQRLRPFPLLLSLIDEKEDEKRNEREEEENASADRKEFHVRRSPPRDIRPRRCAAGG